MPQTCNCIPRCTSRGVTERRCGEGGYGPSPDTAPKLSDLLRELAAELCLDCPGRESCCAGPVDMALTAWSPGRLVVVFKEVQTPSTRLACA